MVLSGYDLRIFLANRWKGRTAGVYMAMGLRRQRRRNLAAALICVRIAEIRGVRFLALYLSGKEPDFKQEDSTEGFYAGFFL